MRKFMIKDIKENGEVTEYFVLESLELRKARNDKEFLMLSLSDKSGKIKGFYWKDAALMVQVLRDSIFVKVKGITKLVGENLSIQIELIRPAEEHEIDINDFLDVVPEGIAFWKQRLLESIDQISESDYRRLIMAFVNDGEFMAKFETTPGGLSIHHNYMGGLLEHTVSTMNLASVIADKYHKVINRDMLMTGAFLHDIGKTREIYFEARKNYTTEGKLLGHILIGAGMVDEKIKELKDFPSELALVIKHMILSHHGEAEFGSPVRPAIPEAIALHMIDNTDAKLNHLICYLKKALPDDRWSNFDRILSTELYLGAISKKIIS